MPTHLYLYDENKDIKLIKVKLVQEKYDEGLMGLNIALLKPYLDTNTSKLVENTKAFE